jgi:endonuclease/exonuclease/phosphatase family metal-dependent hydrolase
LFNRIFLWLHYFTIIGLVVGISAKYISPEIFWVPAFFGLAFPYFYLLNILFMVFWLAQFKAATTLGVIALLLGASTAYRYVQFNSAGNKPTSRELKVTSFNSMLFDLYNWSKNKESRAKILAGIAEIDPDILCLQEFYTSEQSGDFNNTDTIRQKLKMPYFHNEFTITLREHDHWGIATFSKFPIINQGTINFNTSSNNICIFSDIVINTDTIRVYNLHLQSISFSKEDNKFLEDVMAKKKLEDEMASSRNILRRLKRAFIKRTRQADMVAAHIKTSRYPVILCGDFNDTAASYAYEKLSEDLEDSFLERGFGLGRTYAGKWPQFRIDYILHDKRLECSRYRREQETYTDHFPITSYFSNINWSK